MAAQGICPLTYMALVLAAMAAFASAPGVRQALADRHARPLDEAANEPGDGIDLGAQYAPGD